MSRLASTLLLALNALLVLAIAGVWLLGSSSWAPPAAVAPDAAMLQPPGSHATTPIEYSRDRVLERPLFAADRRPISEDAPAVAEAAPQSEPEPEVDTIAGARLTGLVGEGAQAIVILETEEGSRRLHVGERVGGWRLDDVVGNVAVFINGDGGPRRMRIAPASVIGASDASEVIAPRETSGAAAARNPRGDLRERFSGRASRSGDADNAERSARRPTRIQNRSER
jgi:hypothetical protein